MTELKASMLKAHGCEDGPGIDATAGAVDETNAGAVCNVRR